MKVDKKKGLVQQDVPKNQSPEETDVPQVKYQRKATHESTDLNIGPGFEESNDLYGRSKEPVPRRWGRLFDTLTKSDSGSVQQI